MKKKGLLLSILLLIAMVFAPVKTNAANVAYSIFAAKDKEMTTNTLNDSSFFIENAGTSTRVYLGVDVTSGTLNEYTATLKLANSNFKYSSFAPENGWTKVSEKKNEDGSITFNFKNTSGATVGKHLVGTVRINASGTSTENCTITLTGEQTPETPVTPKCKVVDGKYYDNNGKEVTKEAYEKACSSSNPETGAFLPVAVIGLGVAVVVGLFFATKNNKMYQV